MKVLLACVLFCALYTACRTFGSGDQAKVKEDEAPAAAAGQPSASVALSGDELAALLAILDD